MGWLSATMILSLAEMLRTLRDTENPVPCAVYHSRYKSPSPVKQALSERKKRKKEKKKQQQQQQQLQEVHVARVKYINAELYCALRVLITSAFYQGHALLPLTVHNWQN